MVWVTAGKGVRRMEWRLLLGSLVSAGTGKRAERRGKDGEKSPAKGRPEKKEDKLAIKERD